MIANLDGVSHMRDLVDDLRERLAAVSSRLQAAQGTVRAADLIEPAI